MSAFIADFGKNKDGLNLYRINGSEEEINKAIEMLKDVGCEIWEDYELEKSFRNFTVLLKVNVPISNDVRRNKKNETRTN